MKQSIYVPALMVAVVAVCLSSPSRGLNGNLGLYFDTESLSCAANVPCHCSARLYVYGLLQGASSTGITGAEYKVALGTSQADPGWIFVETFDPAATVLGNGAFNPPDGQIGQVRGVNVAWASCQVGDGTKVLIETVDILNVGCGGEIFLEGVKHDTPSNAFLQCPLFTLCDAPVYTKVCLGFNLTLCRNPEPPFPNDALCSTSGFGWINPPPWQVDCGLGPHDCKIDVEAKAWSRVKALYRD